MNKKIDINLFTVIFTIIFSILNCFTVDIIALEVLPTKSNEKIKICFSNEKTFYINKIDNNKIEIALEGNLNNYKAAEKNLTPNPRIKEISYSQDDKITKMLINSYGNIDISNLNLKDKIPCSNIYISNTTLSRLKKDQTPWFSTTKQTIYNIPEYNSNFITSLRSISRNIKRAQKNIFHIATNGTKSEKDLSVNLYDPDNLINSQISSKTTNISNETKSTIPSKKITIIIDPGHGGSIDEGSVNYKSKIKEKDITLKYAKHLQQLLSSKYKVLLTHDKDKFLSISDRVKFVEKIKADLLISLHADSIETPNLSSVSLYRFNSKASDEESEKLARLENSVDYMIANNNIDLKNVNTKQTPNHKIKALSKKFATHASKNLSKILGVNIESHHTGNFTILNISQTPALLIELGFGLQEEDGTTLLNSQSYMNKINNSIKMSIDEYFRAQY